VRQGEDVGNGAVCELIVTMHHEFGPAWWTSASDPWCQHNVGQSPSTYPSAPCSIPLRLRESITVTTTSEPLRDFESRRGRCLRSTRPVANRHTGYTWEYNSGNHQVCCGVFGQSSAFCLSPCPASRSSNGSDRVRRHQDAGSGFSEGTAEQDKRHLDELAPERR
jgi:hypothetical protein